VRKPVVTNSTKNNVSILDVASTAGVSTATVSRVINNPQSTKKSSREAVEDAIRKLGYIPNGAARALSSRNSRIISAIIPTIDHSIFAQGIQALQSYLHSSGYQLLIGSTNYDPKQEYALCQNFLVQQVAGIIMMGETHLPDCVELLNREHTPFVNTGTYSPDSKEYCVGFDNAAAAAKATQYLVSLGHVEFAMIAGITENNDRAVNRVKGVREELKRHGIGLPQNRLLERDYEVDQGREAFRLLMQNKHPPTAILCGNDVLGYGAILEAQRLGVSIPHDVSVMGFDDLALSRHLQPSLTTVHVPTREMWCKAADTLFALMKGKEAPRAVEIEVNLVVRESTSGPKTAK